MTQGQSRVGLAAAGAAFWLVIALFPAVIAAVSIFGLVVNPQQVAKALSDLGEKGEGSLGAAVSRQAQQLASSPSAGLSISLVISVIILLWSVSNGSYNLIQAIRLGFGLAVRGYVRERLRGVLGGFIGVLTLGVIALVVSELTAIDSVVSGLGQVAFSATVGAVTLAAVAIALVGLYKFAIGSSTRPPNLWPGAVLTTIALAILAALLSLAFAGFGGTSSVYGVAAGAISALISVYTGMYLILLGAIINAHWQSNSMFTPIRATRQS